MAVVASNKTASPVIPNYSVKKVHFSFFFAHVYVIIFPKLTTSKQTCNRAKCNHHNFLVEDAMLSASYNSINKLLIR